MLYTQASPEEIEQGITTRVEESLNGIEGIEEITSSSSENISQITVKTYAGFNIDEILQEIKNSVDAIYSFPEGVENQQYKNKNPEVWEEWVIL